MKIRASNNILHNLVGTTWGASSEVMRLSAISLVNSVADYGSPVWILSKHIHLDDTQLNNTVRCVSGTIRATPLPWLPVLTNIVPAKFRRKLMLKSLISKTNLFEESLLFDVLQENVNERLKSRTVIKKIFNDIILFDLNQAWKDWWNSEAVFNHEFICDPTVKINGFDLPRKFWSLLNRIRTCQGCCNSCLYKWGIVDSPCCDCGSMDQTIPHIVLNCPLRRFAGDLSELCNFETSRAKDWLFNLDLKL